MGSCSAGRQASFYHSIPDRELDQPCSRMNAEFFSDIGLMGDNGLDSYRKYVSHFLARIDFRNEL